MYYMMVLRGFAVYDGSGMLFVPDDSGEPLSPALLEEMAGLANTGAAS